MQADDAWPTVNELGKLGCLHFIDLNKDKLAYELHYSKPLKSIDETERKIDVIEQECKRHSIEMPEPSNAQELQTIIDKLCAGKTEMLFLDHIENDINDKERFIQGTMKQVKDIHQSFNSQIIIKGILKQALALITATQIGGASRSQRFQIKQIKIQNSNFNSEGENSDEEDDHALLQRERSNSQLAVETSMFRPIVGSIAAEEQERLKKLIFRVTRGKAFVQFFEIQEKIFDYYGVQQEVVIFFVFCPHDSQYMKDRLKRICDSFHGESYELPTTKEEVEERLGKTKLYLDNLYNTLKLTIDNFKQYLVQIQHAQNADGFSLLKVYKLYLRKNKNIYRTMNKFRFDGSLMIGLFWIPTKFAQNAQEQIRTGGRSRLAQIYEVKDHKLTPPTFFEINEFMWPYHEICVTYGTPNYREINPTTFNMVTFPFLFGLMFGDIGHGTLLLLFAVYVCLNADGIEKTMPSLKVFVKIRYLLLLLGFFALYAGFIYNDMLSLPLDLFGSCFATIDNHTSVVNLPDCIYPFGFDPKWYVSSNEISFFNSFKMKYAVIIGVAQMSLGVCMKGLNAVHNKSKIDFFFEFLPQLIFLLSIFGLMDLLIILKWLTNWEHREGDAPSITTQMINIAIKGGIINGTALLWDDATQIQISRTCVILAVLMVPLMLFVKPWYLNKEARRLEQEAHVEHVVSGGGPAGNNTSDSLEIHAENQQLMKTKDRSQDVDWFKKVTQEGSSGHPQIFSELFIHQLIETIEFVLGCISNTASYLRLWALSLAHGQLSKVFFSKTIGLALTYNSILLMTLSFFVFATASFFVLMFMDVLECFLHDLRLHWVEFQNKFFKGQGYKFTPMSHQKAIYLED